MSSDYLNYTEISKDGLRKKFLNIRNKSKNPLKRFSKILVNIFYKGFAKEIISNKILRNKVLITIFIVFIYRLLASVPLPGVNMSVYQDVIADRSVTEANYLFSLFTGGQLDSPSLVGLGLAAYINASIIMQMLPYAINKLKEIQKQGERGKQIINQITRFITLPLSLIYSTIYLIYISQQDLGSGRLIDLADGSNIPSVARIFFMALALTAGTLLLMWLSEVITEKGIGNGSSIIIAVGILSTIPSLILADFAKLDLTDIFSQISTGVFVFLTSSVFISIVGTIIGLIIIIIFVTFINEAVRKVSINYSRRPRESYEDTQNSSYLPIKLTLTGVLPVIFTFAFLSLPQIFVPLLEGIVDKSSPFYSFLDSLKNTVFFAPNDNELNYLDGWYAVVYFFMVLFFSVFYSFIVLNPKETSENLQKIGAYIPGIRPGKSTEDYLTKIIIKVSFIGGIFLGLVALSPIIGRNLVLASTGTTLAILSGIGGTSLLIVVSVVVDLIRQYKSIKATKGYEKFL